VADDAAVDQALLLVAALRELERPHLRLLHVLAEPGPIHIFGSDARPGPNPSVLKAVRIAESCGLGVPVWPVEAILESDPGLAGGIEAVTSRLESLGLVRTVWDDRLARWCWAITELGEACVQHLVERGSAASPAGGQ